MPTRVLDGLEVVRIAKAARGRLVQPAAVAEFRVGAQAVGQPVSQALPEHEFRPLQGLASRHGGR
ncbi:hypothetical protein EAS64_05465 [Trebonia kvetii]|uniref:Uncharacterized protein n=1 Tax=Trebonia kvetii TaxID=2480626 RepID=A0A6P2C5U2_9ACTN|nr:hypothetical protein [Trebonia kvetii]TVZ06802.1 hypothetical protein EAS64_05465 [Trebonia kvetii]